MSMRPIDRASRTRELRRSATSSLTRQGLSSTTSSPRGRLQSRSSKMHLGVILCDGMGQSLSSTRLPVLTSTLSRRWPLRLS